MTPTQKLIQKLEAYPQLDRERAFQRIGGMNDAEVKKLLKKSDPLYQDVSRFYDRICKTGEVAGADYILDQLIGPT